MSFSGKGGGPVEKLRMFVRMEKEKRFCSAMRTRYVEGKGEIYATLPEEKRRKTTRGDFLT